MIIEIHGAFVTGVSVTDGATTSPLQYNNCKDTRMGTGVISRGIISPRVHQVRSIGANWSELGVREAPDTAESPYLIAVVTDYLGPRTSRTIDFPISHEGLAARTRAHNTLLPLVPQFSGFNVNKHRSDR